MVLGLLPSNIPREKIPPEGLVILFLAYSPGAFPTNSIDLLRWFQMCEQRSQEISALWWRTCLLVWFSRAKDIFKIS
jgi:hypothetical protein